MVNIGFKFGVVARHVLSLCLVSAAASLLGQDAKTTLVIPPSPLLPAKFGSWQLEGISPSCFDCLQPEGEAAGVLKEDGLKRASRLTYHQPNKTETITAEAYQFDDATGAFSAFTYLRRPEMRTLPEVKRIGTSSATNGVGDFLFWSGTSVVKAKASSAGASTINDLRQLSATLPKIGGPKGLAPLLPTYLPAKGLETETLKYALGQEGLKAMDRVLPAEIIGFDKAAEVAMAKYAGRGTLTLLLYPTPQIAGDHGRLIETEMNRQGTAAGTVKLRREGPMVMMTTGAWTAEDAKAMVEGIHLRNEVTWNKQMPVEFHAEVQKTASLLTSIAIFCGMGALAAVVLALFLGGGRAAIRVLQGKPAASEPEFLRIDLSGRAASLQVEPQGGNSQKLG